jgi:hypothetical protein
LYSEDMQHGQEIDGQLVILQTLFWINPFCLTQQLKPKKVGLRKDAIHPCYLLWFRCQCCVVLVTVASG